MIKKKTIVILIFSVITALLSMGVTVFFLKVIQNKNIHSSVVSAVLNEKIIKKNNQKLTLEKINELEEQNKNIDKYFLDSKQIDLFVEFLEKFGLDNNTKLSVDDIELSPTDKNIFIVRTSIKGTIGNIMKTVSLLENTPYQININSFYLNKQINSSELGDETVENFPWQAELSFNILSL